MPLVEILELNIVEVSENHKIYYAFETGVPPSWLVLFVKEILETSYWLIDCFVDWVSEWVNEWVSEELGNWVSEWVSKSVYMMTINI